MNDPFLETDLVLGREILPLSQAAIRLSTRQFQPRASRLPTQTDFRTTTIEAASVTVP